MHNPWWVVTTMDGEADPVPMLPTDKWCPLSQFTGIGPAGENVHLIHPIDETKVF